MDATKRHDRVVFLDRDGVIDKAPPLGEWVLRWEEFEFADGALAALRRLRERGFTVVVVTNQSCVGRGLVTRDVVDDINSRMCESVAAAGGEISGVYCCPHTEADGCACRKPKPGLIDRAARELSLSPDRAFLIGDTERDIGAGAARGCTTILVAQAGDAKPTATRADHVVGSLSEAVELVLGLVGG
jgi:D-glycero-D-manno-heptose 1,7-bisphosphate phosphatase